MDFSKIKSSLLETTKKVADSAKEFGGKALQFGGEQLANTKSYIHSNDEYDTILAKKRAVIVAIDEGSEFFDDVMLMLPVWQAFAFTDMIDLHFVGKKTGNDTALSHGYVFPLEMRVFFEGKEIKRLSNMADIRAWWKSRDFSETSDQIASDEAVSSEAKTQAPVSSESEEARIDPLLTSK